MKGQNSPSKIPQSNNTTTSKPTYTALVQGTPSPDLVTKAVVVLAPKLKLAQKTVQDVNDVNFSTTSVKAADPSPC